MSSVFSCDLVKFKSISYINSMFSGLVLMYQRKSIISRIPGNISNLLLDLNCANLNRIFFFDKVSNLNNRCKMIFFNKFFHNDCNPFPFLRYNNFSFLSVLTPSPPLSFNFVFKVINKYPGDCRTIWIVVQIIAKTNYRFIVF